MKRLTADCPEAQTLLDFLIEQGSTMLPAIGDAWLAGDVWLTMDFSYIARNTQIAERTVPTVLLYLEAGGYIETDFASLKGSDLESTTIERVSVSLNLPAGAAAA